MKTLAAVLRIAAVIVVLLLVALWIIFDELRILAMYTKPAFKSKTIIGALISLAVMILPSFGISFGEADAALIGSTADNLIAVAGAALTVYGRVTASHDIAIK